MQILGRFCFLIIFCSVLEFYKRFLQIFGGFFMMDCASCLKFLSQNSEFGFGFFGCFTRVCNVLGFFLMFGLGLKVLQYGGQCNGLSRFLCEFRGKSCDLIYGFCSKIDFAEVCDSKGLSCKWGLLEFLKNLNPPNMEIDQDGTAPEVHDNYELCEFRGKSCDLINGFCSKNDFSEVRDLKGLSCKCGLLHLLKNSNPPNIDNDELYDEDEEVDVVALRKLVKMERQRANAACVELEKERMAAASAAEEAMAMILRLQNGKSSIEIESHQYQRTAKQKQLYDHEVIEALRWMVMKHECERNLLEDQLRLCKEKLKLYVKVDEVDQLEGVDVNLSFFSSTMEEDGLGDVLMSSLDMESPQL